MRPALERLNREVASSSVADSSVELRHAIRQVVCFPLFSSGAQKSVEAAFPDQLTAASKASRRTLDGELARRFFDELWVPRPEVGSILSSVTEGRSLTVLTGEKGAGKTTIVRQVH